MKFRFFLIATVIVFVAALVMYFSQDCLNCRETVPPRPIELSTGKVVLAVMDPLALENACACVKGYAQRDYKALATHLNKELKREIEVVFCSSIETVKENTGSIPDIIIGKKSIIEYDANKSGMLVQHAAMLTGLKGKTTLTGLFITMSESELSSIEDLKGKTIAFGPEDSDEKHFAALETLKSNNVESPSEPVIKETCTISAMSVINGQADAAVISSYAVPIMLGCETISEGELKIIGKTEEVPFIAVYTTEKANLSDFEAIQAALLKVSDDKQLLKKLESLHGFVKPGADLSELNGWTDWGGRNRTNTSVHVPVTLSDDVELLWEKHLTSQSLGGLAATTRYVVVSDKSDELDMDVWRCLDTDTGNERWQVSYTASGEMDYTNAPRATPVINNGKVYLLGAKGDLHCVELETGKIVWKLNLIDNFGGDVPTWGFCSTPLIVDDKLIVLTSMEQSDSDSRNATTASSEQTALSAINPDDGDVIWQTTGCLPGYGNLIAAMFGGKRQIIGHDAVSLGGWDIETGQRLWTLIPPEENDFNVPTPIQFGDKLLVSTENNGTRLYAFNSDGTIIPQPVAVNADLAPDTASPILAGDKVWGICYNGLYCLDPDDGLKTVWMTDEDPFNDYASLISGNGQVLVTAINGTIALIPENPSKGFLPKAITVLKSTGDFDVEVWSQPAIVDGRMFIRSNDRVVCLLLTE